MDLEVSESLALSVISLMINQSTLLPVTTLIKYLSRNNSMFLFYQIMIYINIERYS